MQACVHVCMRACMHVCMYVCMYVCMHAILNHYSAKARVISLHSQSTRPKAELAKIRRYHASLSAIMVL